MDDTAERTHFWLARGLEKVYLLLSFKLHRHWALTSSLRATDMGTPPQNMSVPQSPLLKLKAQRQSGERIP